jgi:hypothetical protein
VERLADHLERLGRLVSDFPVIGEIDINPLKAAAASCVSSTRALSFMPQHVPEGCPEMKKAGPTKGPAFCVCPSALEFEKKVRVRRNGPRIGGDQHLQAVDIAPQGLHCREDLVAVALGLLHGGADSLRLLDSSFQLAEVLVRRIEDNGEFLQDVFGTAAVP